MSLTKGLLCGVSLAALGACAELPQGPSMPVRYAPAPAYYNPYQRPAYVPPPQYAANGQPGARYNPATRRFEWGNMAGPAAVGAVGGMLANRALTGAESHAMETVAEKGAERLAGGAAERTIATRAAESVVARGVGAAALTAAEDAEAAEIIEIIATRLIWFAL